MDVPSPRRSSLTQGATTSRRAEELLADGRGHDRQILVVGNGTMPTLTAGFLEQAGFDPVLASVKSPSPEPGSITLWEPSLKLLERLGLRRPVEQLGTTVQGRMILNERSFRSGTVAAESTLVSVCGEELQRLVTDQLCDRLRTSERPVVSLERRDSGVCVTFESDITEPFDIVATTTPSLLSQEEPYSCPTCVDYWGVDWPETFPKPGVSVEAWTNGVGVCTNPIDDSARVHLMSITDMDGNAAVTSHELDQQFGHLFTELPNPFEVLDNAAMQYRQIPQIAPRSLYRGAIARVGPAARPAIPGDCIGPTLGLEDAWVLADALAYGPERLAEALAAYETRRCRRAFRLISLIDERTSSDTGAVDSHPVLQRLADARQVAFGHVTDSSISEFDKGIPDQL